MVSGYEVEAVVYALSAKIGYDFFGVGLHGLEGLDFRVGFLIAEEEVGPAALFLYGLRGEPLCEAFVPERAREADYVSENVADHPLPECEQARKGDACKGTFGIGTYAQLPLDSRNDIGCESGEKFRSIAFEVGCTRRLAWRRPGGEVVVPVHACYHGYRNAVYLCGFFNPLSKTVEGVEYVADFVGRFLDGRYFKIRSCECLHISSFWVSH